MRVMGWDSCDILRRRGWLVSLEFVAIVFVSLLCD